MIFHNLDYSCKLQLKKCIIDLLYTVSNFYIVSFCKVIHFWVIELTVSQQEEQQQQFLFLLSVATDKKQITSLFSNLLQSHFYLSTIQHLFQRSFL